MPFGDAPHSAAGLDINLSQATMEFSICCYKGVSWMIFSSSSGPVSICCVWSSADICHWKYVRIEALRWITIVKAHFEMFPSRPPTFHLNNQSKFSWVWMFHIVKYTTIMVLNYRFTQHTTAFSDLKISLCWNLKSKYGSRLSHWSLVELLRL